MTQAEQRALKIEKTRELAAQGLTYAEMATYFGETYAAVMSRCQNHNIDVIGKQKKAHLDPDRKQALEKGCSLVKDDGYNTVVAARMVGLKLSTLKAYINNERVKQRQKLVHSDEFAKPNQTIAFVHQLFLTNPIVNNPNRFPAW